MFIICLGAFYSTHCPNKKFIVKNITTKPILIIHWMALVAEFSIVSLTTFIFLSSLPLFLFLALLMLRSFICWTDLVSYHSPLWTNAIFCKDIYSILHHTVCSSKACTYTHNNVFDYNNGKHCVPTNVKANYKM